MTLDLEEIRSRAEAATTPPWVVASEIDGFRAGRETVVKADGRRVVTVDQTRPHYDSEAEANVAFIASARSDVPVLIAEVERLRKVAWTYLRAMNDQHAVFGHYLDGCEKCRGAAEEMDGDLACDEYKRWQKTYTDALGQVIEEVAW